MRVETIRSPWGRFGDITVVINPNLHPLPSVCWTAHSCHRFVQDAAFSPLNPTGDSVSVHIAVDWLQRLSLDSPHRRSLFSNKLNAFVVHGRHDASNLPQTEQHGERNKS